jgi:hypothetical protein
MEEAITWFEGVQEKVQQSVEQWPDVVLMVALLTAAAFLIGLAFTPNHRVFKATVLAYILLP